MGRFVRRKTCVHCHARTGHVDKRGLCNNCFARRSIRRRYPAPDYDRNGDYGEVRDFNGDRGLPDAPTSALPWTEEKILVLQLRAMAGVALRHPKDARG